MVCDPANNNINIPPPGGGPSIPGFDPPFAVPKPPFPDVGLPDGIPEDIIDLIERFFALFPQNIRFEVTPDSFMKGIWDALADLFNKLAPFLAFYKFIQALLEIILCVIDVLCALMNPFATLRAIKRLFSQCLPNFLSLFPWIALILMIIALILLLIALIIYIIETILAYIQQIIRNIQILVQAIQKADAISIVTAVNKLSDILCLIEGLFGILLAFAALIAIIEPLLAIGGIPNCAAGQSSCCTDDFCPPWMRSGPDGQPSFTGRMIYYQEVGPDIPDSAFDWLANVPGFVQRPERFQFIDEDNENFNFIDIITPSPEFFLTYWPDGSVYDSNSNTVKVPYLVDMNLSLDPADFGNPDDTDGPRFFNIRDCIVSVRPRTYYNDFQNDRVSVTGGSVVIVGGLVWEYDPDGTDGYSEYRINGDQATLETLIGRDDDLTQIPPVDDGYQFFDIEYLFKYNYEPLIEKGIVTLMCQPDAGAEAATLGAEFNDLRSAFDKLGPLPDVGTLNDDRTDGTGTLGCMARALTKFRRDINIETTAVFQQEIIQCLEDLLDESKEFYCQAAVFAVDRFGSDFTIDPTEQFVGLPISVTVVPKDKSGTPVFDRVDPELVACVADALKARATFGEVSDFVYDGYSSFIAELTSDAAGTGEIRAFIDEEVFAEVINRDNEALNSEIVDRVLEYEFIDQTSIDYRKDPATRFGPDDIAEDGS